MRIILTIAAVELPKNAFDLILMGTRGLGTYTGAALGSVAQGVAQRSTVPLLLVKRDRFDRRESAVIQVFLQGSS